MVIKSVMFFANGVTAVFDQSGQQVAELQEPWLKIFVEWIEKQTGQELPLEVELMLPSGKTARRFKTSDGWNWDV